MNFKSKIKLYLSVLCLLFITGVANAELMIQITGGSKSPIPIAIVPFANLTAQPLPETMETVISDDLKRSGKFSTLPTSQMLSLPSDGKDVYYQDWKTLGQNYLLIGKIQYSTSEQLYHVTYELFDVFQKTRLLGEELTTSAKGLRKVAHIISDAVFEKITGVRGIFTTKIAYVTLEKNNSVDNYRLQIADSDGHNAQVLLESHEPIMSPAWSPDGSKIAYVSFENGHSQVFSQEIATGKRESISNDRGINSSPAWSPDGKSMIVTRSVSGNAELYLIDLSSLKATRLTHQYGIDTEASWSPDGKSIVYTSDQSGTAQVYLMSMSNFESERLTFDGRYNSRANFFPDGKSIYFIHKSSDASFNVARMDLSTNNIQVLTSTTLDDSPSLSPNGRLIIYSTIIDNKRVLAVFALDGSTNYFLPAKQGEVRDPAWSPYLSNN
jgi:TolB protein